MIVGGINPMSLTGGNIWSRIDAILQAQNNNGIDKSNLDASFAASVLDPNANIGSIRSNNAKNLAIFGMTKGMLEYAKEFATYLIKQGSFFNDFLGD